MKIAVEGCVHGELDKVYEAIAHLEKTNKFKVDLLIICGDFQAVRNRADLNCMAVPRKYRDMKTFYKYYSGEVKAPILTVFVGGNHEASNYLSELPYGGWVCPNIYYMGYANVINVGNLRIGGLSGIYKGHDYLKGHFEFPPYDEATKRSAYHIRNIDVFRLKQIHKPVDIFISHDWPRGIYHYGNKKELLQKKEFFKTEIENNTLGSRPGEELLHKLKPKYWFAAHLHCKFAAVVEHDNGSTPSVTKFLALDKCLPRRNFLQILEIGDELKGPVKIQYDSEWLSILCLTNHLLSTENKTCYMPGPGCSERWDFKVGEKEIKEVEMLFDSELTMPDNFAITASTHDPVINRVEPIQVFFNPQTIEFCKKLGLTDPMAAILSGKPASGINISKVANNSELNVTVSSEPSINPDEIMLDSEGEGVVSNKISPANSSDSEEVVGAKSSDPSSNISFTEEFGGFFIDKERNLEQSTSDSSPLTPLEQRRGLHLQYCSTPQDLTNIEKTKFPELKRDHHKSIEEYSLSKSPVSSCIKKFKRRNQEIYNSRSDDE